ncbi:MAG: hypothetical protein H0W84_06875, partial [Bacteroidetes bacterium]|nr:hypothetical protein [Bacteroidota bacterium]
FMSDRNILIAFTGHMDHKVTTSLLKNIKSKLNLFPARNSADIKVYSILVESMENISKHASQQNRAMLLLSKTETTYSIVAGNPVENKNVPALRGRLEKISKLDNSELKKIYRDKLISGQGTEISGGLGMLDIAIKSQNKLKYDFQPLSELMSFYLLQIEINIQ